MKAIGEIGGTIGKISEIAKAVAMSVEQQISATREIADNVQQAATGTQEVASNIDGIQKSASGTGSAATQLLGATQELTKQNELLAGQVNEFLAGIRAE